MAWGLIFWVLYFSICLILIASSFYQLLCLVDLEADHLNPVDASLRINPLVVPEFLTHGLLTAVFLATGLWLMFLTMLPLACYNVKLYMKGRYRIDPTEVFRDLSSRKMYQKHKLFFYLSLIIIITARMTWDAFCSETGTTSFLDLFSHGVSLS